MYGLSGFMREILGPIFFLILKYAPQNYKEGKNAIFTNCEAF